MLDFSIESVSAGAILDDRCRAERIDPGRFRNLRILGEHNYDSISFCHDFYIFYPGGHDFSGLPCHGASLGGCFDGREFPGRYPVKMRFAAVGNIGILVLMALIVLSRAGLLLPGMRSFAGIAVWVIVVYSFAGTIMNLISPSRIERIWAPVALIQGITGLIVALS